MIFDPGNLAWSFDRIVLSELAPAERQKWEQLACWVFENMPYDEMFPEGFASADQLQEAEDERDRLHALCAEIAEALGVEPADLSGETVAEKLGAGQKEAA